MPRLDKAQAESLVIEYRHSLLRVLELERELVGAIVTDGVNQSVRVPFSNPIGEMLEAADKAASSTAPAMAAEFVKIAAPESEPKPAKAPKAPKAPKTPSTIPVTSVAPATAAPEAPAEQPSEPVKAEAPAAPAPKAPVAPSEPVQAKAAPVAEAPAAPAAGAPTPSAHETGALLRRVMEAKGPETAIEMLTRYKASNISKLTVEQRVIVFNECKALLGE